MWLKIQNCHRRCTMLCVCCDWMLHQPLMKNTTSKSTLSKRFCSSAFVLAENFIKHTHVLHRNQLVGELKRTGAEPELCQLETTHPTPSLNHPNHPSHSLYNNTFQQGRKSPSHLECQLCVSAPHAVFINLQEVAHTNDVAHASKSLVASRKRALLCNSRCGL